MAATLKNFSSQLKTFFSELSIERKLAFFLVVMAVAVAIYFTAVYVTTPNYGVLYSNLNPTSASSIITKLHSYGIPYKLADRGKTLLIPKGSVYKIRIKLASIGLPHQEGVGFSIFNHVPIGMTDFIQHVDYQRALQGELERTINQINQIKHSSVLIVLPRRSVFVSRKESAKASIIVKLKSGMYLSRMQVNGIIHLVASAVDGLKPKNITIINTDGKILSIPIGNSFKYTASQLGYVHEIEKNLEGKINSMLIPVVGIGNIVSKVYVKVNFSRKTESQLIYNPNTTAIVSQQTYSSSSTGAVRPYGIPGTKSNLPPGKIPIQAVKPSIHTVKKETINYDVSKKIEKISYPTGTIKRIYASVLVNGVYKKIKSSKGKFSMKYVPRSSSEMSLFKNIIKTAIGYSKASKDEVVIANIPFKKMLYTIPVPPKKTIKSIIESNFSEIVKYGVILLGVILIILLILRPLMKYIMTYESKSPARSSEEERLEALDQMKRESPSKPEPSMKDIATNIVRSDPEAAANYVKNLLKETGRET
ncbi:MAG TPA: flagellar M-ring protein FliF [bacterium]|nr:flagellar M-ring protein FliF [bacterium]